MRTIKNSYRRRSTIRQKRRGGMFGRLGRMSFSNWTGSKKNMSPTKKPLSPPKNMEGMTEKQKAQYIKDYVFNRS